MFLECRVVSNILTDPNEDNARGDQFPPVLVSVHNVEDLQEMPHQLLDGLVPLLTDGPHVVVAGQEEERVGAQQVKLPLARRHHVDAEIVLDVHLSVGLDGHIERIAAPLPTSLVQPVFGDGDGRLMDEGERLVEVEVEV